jgi:hypothetical protein
VVANKNYFFKLELAIFNVFNSADYLIMMWDLDIVPWVVLGIGIKLPIGTLLVINSKNLKISGI